MATLVKVCPSCNTKNPAAEYLCVRCSADLMTVLPRSDSPGAATTPAEEPPISPQVAEQVSSEQATTLANAARLIDGQDREIQLQPGTTLGRSAIGSAVLKDEMLVSRRHAQFFFENSRWLIEDLGSTNFTFVNGRRINPGQKHPLHTGDKIEFSTAVAFVFHAE